MDNIVFIVEDDEGNYITETYYESDILSLCIKHIEKIDKKYKKYSQEEFDIKKCSSLFIGCALEENFVFFDARYYFKIIPVLRDYRTYTDYVLTPYYRRDKHD